MRKLNGLWWPETDTKLMQVFDWVSDIGEIIKYVDNFGVCVQAGGACGQWPAEFAKYFDRVYTFEPVLENFECLIKNIPANVTAEHAAIGNDTNPVSMGRDDFESGNAGAWYVDRNARENVRMMRLDDYYGFDGCDLIQLDVEGYEYQALLGAAETIAQYRPTIVLEEKQLPHMNGPCTQARDFLTNFGYREVAALHRDVVFKC